MAYFNLLIIQPSENVSLVFSSIFSLIALSPGVGIRYRVFNNKNSYISLQPSLGYFILPKIFEINQDVFFEMKIKQSFGLVIFSGVSYNYSFSKIVNHFQQQNNIEIDSGVQINLFITSHNAVILSPDVIFSQGFKYLYPGLVLGYAHAFKRVRVFLGANLSIERTVRVFPIPDIWVRF